ncbi:MAG: hypothetical protein JXR65_07025 [Bacteroidales bacterium]|nr:hypothetical protein [Bacteroidales bacterium]
MVKKNSRHHLFDEVQEKSSMKDDVFTAALQSFQLMKQVSEQLSSEYTAYTLKKKASRPGSLSVNHHGDFEFALQFGGDTLLFLLHTNVFEIPRDHNVMRTKYIQEDPTRSYCGIVHIYNFLTDSFKYNRVNDLGYLIGRIFINREQHYFIDGKSELGFMYNNFRNHKISEKNVEEIITSAIEYTLNFDLLIPPYEQVKLLTVSEMQNTLDVISFKTGKRLGFQFYADQDPTV